MEVRNKRHIITQILDFGDLSDTSTGYMGVVKEDKPNVEEYLERNINKIYPECFMNNGGNFLPDIVGEYVLFQNNITIGIINGHEFYVFMQRFHEYNMVLYCNDIFMEGTYSIEEMVFILKNVIFSRSNKFSHIFHEALVVPVTETEFYNDIRFMANRSEYKGSKSMQQFYKALWGVLEKEF